MISSDHDLGAIKDFVHEADDLVFGDNVSLDRTTHLGNFTNLRFEQLTGTLMYDPTTGQPLVDNVPRLDPRRSARWAASACA